MREAAFAGNVLTAGELAELKRAADALAAPGYFDDLPATATKVSRQAREALNLSPTAPLPATHRTKIGALAHVVA